MGGGEQVLRARLLPPRPRPHILMRPRLQEKLSEALEVPLTIVQAGPGYGKTTALTSFLRTQPHPVVWYSASEGEAAPLPFLRHLIQALRARNALLGEKALTILEEGRGDSSPWHLAVAALVDDIAFSSQPETLVVLDDFHAIDPNPEIIAAVDYLVEQLPPQIHLILSTRRRPLLPSLPKWRARAEVLELGQVDLAFTSSEVLELFQDQYGVDLAAEQTREVTDRTEGWIIALQLIWQGLRKGSPLKRFWDASPASLDTLFRYLAHEVLNRQKPFVQRFLLATAALDRLVPAACDAVMGEVGSDRVLRALEENGLLLQPVGDGIYRYHQLFQQFLLGEALREPTTLRACHAAAAAHFTSTSDYAEAAGHYLSAGEADPAADAIAEVGAAMLRAGQTDALGRLIDQLPIQVLERRPDLLLLRGDIARLTSRFDQALIHYRQAAEAADDERNRCRALMGQAQVFLDTISPSAADEPLAAALRGSETLRDDERAQLLAMVAENEMNRGHPSDAARFASLASARIPLNEDLEVRAHLRTGRLAAAMAQLEQTNRPGLTGASRSHREAPLLISLIAAMTGDRERSRIAAEEGIRLGLEKRSPFVRGVGLIRLGHALQLNPHVGLQATAAPYHKAMDLMDTLNVVRGKAEPLAGLSLLHGHVAGDWALARQYGLDGARIAEAAHDHWFYGFCLLAVGGSAAVLGHDEAAGYLQLAAKAFEESGDPHGLTLTQIWRAWLAHRHSDLGAFRAAAQDALDGARENGYGFLFTRGTLFGLRDPQALIPVLREAQRHGIRPEYAAGLLAELGVSNPDLHPGFTLRIRTLGQFQAWRGNQEISHREWQREKAKNLLQILVTFRGKVLQRDEIIDMLWPGSDAATGSRDFKVALNSLLTALEPGRTARSGSFHLYRRGTAYGLNAASGYWLDADEFARLSSEGFALAAQGCEPEAGDRLRRALDLYHGDFLQDLPYEDWCNDERERLQVLYLRAAQWLAQFEARQGNYENCIRYGELILARDRCWEEAYRLLMLSYYRLGNRAMAMRAYDKCVQNLQSGLGITPMPVTANLYERIRHNRDAFTGR